MCEITHILTLLICIWSDGCPQKLVTILTDDHLYSMYFTFVEQANGNISNGNITSEPEYSTTFTSSDTVNPTHRHPG